MAPGERQRPVSAAGEADMASWCCVLALVLLLVSLAGSGAEEQQQSHRGGLVVVARGPRPATRACEELYVVAEGETLHSISDRCGDPYILERNPHVHDPDDVFPGLVIKITPRAGGGNPK